MSDKISVGDKITMPTKPLLPRIFVNSFPKAGTHLALMLVAPLAKPQTREDEGPHGEWFGTFRNSAFSDDWVPVEDSVNVVRGQPPGVWMKGHCGYQSELEDAFEEMGTCVIFIYRDLRDVAVSLAYHIENTDGHGVHAERELYLDLPTHEDRLVAIIEGFGKDPGLVKRWELYAPWINVDWIWPIRFEDVIANKRGAAEKTTQYVIKRTANHYDFVPFVLESQYNLMVETSLQYMSDPEQYSSTFRKGVAGEWRKEFTPRVARAFEAAGGNVWIDRLGYER